MTPSETVTLIALVRALWPGMRMEEATPDAWHEVLGDLPASEAAQAVKMLARTHPGYIGPADIRRAVYDATGVLSGASRETALARVASVASDQGVGRGALGPLAAQVYDALGGAPVIANMPSGVLRREFREIWDESVRARDERLLRTDFDQLVRKAVES